MAETKTRASGAQSKPAKRKAAKARKSPATKSSNGASASRSTKSRASGSAKRTPKRRSPASKNGANRVDTARNAVEETTKHAGHSVGDAASSVGRAASKAKTPLLASGAAIAGVAGGLALGTRQSRRSKVLSRRPKVKIDSSDLARAAKEVGQFGVDVGQLASELRRNREQANGKSHSRSPIEVVLQGLTSRGKDS